MDTEKVFIYIDDAIQEKKDEIEYLGKNWTVAQVMYLVGCINTYVDIRDILYREIEGRKTQQESEE